MSRTNIGLCVSLLLMVCAAPLLAQQPAVASSTSSAAVVPPLVSFNGVLTDLSGKPITGVTGVTFALYKDSQGGAPLWLETQNVYPDKTGHYTVLLGSTTSSGLPPDLFVAGEARWLAVQVQGQAEQPRTSLTSVPYSLKAADAQTVGGLPASAFVLAAPPSSTSGSAANASAAVQPMATGTTPVTTAGGTVNKLAKFDAAADITSSQIFDNGTNVGIGNTAPAAKLDVSGSETVRGLLYLPTKGTATTTTAYTSQPLRLTASAFNSGTGTAAAQNFQWQAEPVGNNTATTSGTLNLLYATGTNTLAETGLKISSKGVFTFATGQTFPGTGTITGITTATGSGLTGGGASGTLNLGLLTSCTSGQLLKWTGTAWACSTPTSGTVTSVATGTGLTGGPITTSGTLSIDATKVPLLAKNNIFSGTQSITGSLGINTTSPTQTLDVSSGNAVVRGSANFKGTGNTAFLYVGDTSHPIEAIWNTGLAIGVYKVPQAFFIQDGTGRVGIGTTTPAYTLDVHGTGNFTGPVTFASGQTFPGTIAGVTAGADLTGGGTSGTVTLNLDTTKVPLLCCSNSFSSTQYMTSSNGYSLVVGNNNSSGNDISVTPGASGAGIIAQGGYAGLWAFSSQYPVYADTSNGNQAVYGINRNNSNYATGLLGLGAGTTAQVFGVEGFSDSPAGAGVYGVNSSRSSRGSSITWGAGVWGDGGSASQDIGVLGTADDYPAVVATDNSADYYTLEIMNTNGSGPLFYAANTSTGGSCIIDNNGNLICVGGSSSLVSTDGGQRKVALSAIESPQNWFEDFGSGELSNGAATVPIEPEFTQTVNTQLEYHVFLTPNGDCKGLFVSQKSPASFEVHELGGGTSNVRFDYRIVALRKNYENIRMADHTNDPDPMKMMKRTGAPFRFETSKMKPPERPAPMGRLALQTSKPTLAPK